MTITTDAAGGRWAPLATPAALLDRQRLQHNITRLQQRMDALGMRLRPHVKTSKSWPVVQAPLAAGAQGITVSTLKEAARFAEVRAGVHVFFVLVMCNVGVCTKTRWR